MTNEDRGVTTKTSEHTAMTIGPTDVCFDPPKQKPVPHINHVTTDKAVEHTRLERPSSRTATSCAWARRSRRAILRMGTRAAAS
ncbi:hypothetical protein [Polyangium mundeleinium]|uniref:Uncharacterized protein n=1 Tax=Polyangium mundeleinium TaxID=2995306 RepID=A0ABT5F1Q0_9BACT|nr:hypothetical protein [Polyangium mundeleinium]MDC0747524.1 hypothetical protein [Polyangium mundeleinium]